MIFRRNPERTQDFLSVIGIIRVSHARPRFRERARRSSGLPDPAALAQAIVDLLTDRQAADIVLLDISHVSSLADYFVIATGTSARQLNSLTEALDEDLRLDGVRPKPRRTEGTAESGWILLDYGDVVVHLFGQEEREFYKLEGLWSRSASVVRFQ
jgi:ribosome-associated protein